MNLHTNFKAKPGAYRHGKLEGIFIMKTIVTHLTDEAGVLVEAKKPHVIVEPMIQNIQEHRAYAFTEEEFLHQFSPL